MNLRLKTVARGINLQLGRFGYTSGAESPSGDPKIEAVKRQRVDSRLIGEFEWALYQRAFDGAFGSSVVGAYSKGSGQIDVVGWIAGQTGTWYEQSHHAWAGAGEIGYQWSKAAGRPWLRSGVFRASGDADPADTSHRTFFPVMPTVRRYSLPTVYSLMNLDDVFVQALVSPSPKLSVRVDLHRLDLATSQDRWYSGGGATQKAGTNFGYAGRRSNGATSLGTMIEGSADRAISRHWSVNGYVGVMKGGDVVRRTFAGDWLTFAYVESVVQIGGRVAGNTAPP